MATFEKRVSSSGKTSWRVRIRRDGEQQISQTFARKSDAEAWARDIETNVDRGFAIPNRERLRKTLSDAIDRWIEDRLPHMAKDDHQNTSNMLAYWRGAVGRVALLRLDPERIEAEARKLAQERDKGGELVRTESRVNRYIATLSRVLGYAHKTLRWIPSNPCTAVRRYKESPGRTRFLSEDEARTLLAAVDARGKPDFSLFVRIAMGTGARRNEITTLRWSDIDLERARISFNATKTNEVRTVPLPAVLIPLIKEHGKVRPISREAPVFKHAFYFDWREVQGTLPNFVFHSLRHSVASHIAMNGGSMLDIAAVTGHKTLAMIKRYSHLSDEHVRNTLERATDGLLK